MHGGSSISGNMFGSSNTGGSRYGSSFTAAADMAQASADIVGRYLLMALTPLLVSSYCLHVLLHLLMVLTPLLVSSYCLRLLLHLLVLLLPPVSILVLSASAAACLDGVASTAYGL